MAAGNVACCRMGGTLFLWMHVQFSQSMLLPLATKRRHLYDHPSTHPAIQP